MLNSEFLQKIEKIYQEFKQHDASQSDRITRYRNIEPESAEILNILIRTKQAKNILEIGTSTGYSTLWLANAAKAIGGHVTTLEIDEARTNIAKANATSFELYDWIDFKVGDAKAYLNQCKEEFDFILVDAERDAYCDYWSDLQRLLKAKDGLMVVDNVISHASEVERFIEIVKQNSSFISTILNVGAGLFMVTRIDEQQESHQ